MNNILIICACIVTALVYLLIRARLIAGNNDKTLNKVTAIETLEEPEAPRWLELTNPGQQDQLPDININTLYKATERPLKPLPVKLRRLFKRIYFLKEENPGHWAGYFRYEARI